MNAAILLVSLATFAAVPYQTTTGSASTPEAKVRQAHEAWAKGVESKSVERNVALYDAEAVTAGSPMLTARGPAAIREMWTQVFAEPEFFLAEDSRNKGHLSSTCTPSTGAPLFLICVVV